VNKPLIQRFMCCASCERKKPSKATRREYARLEVGLTTEGLQVWCVRCEKEVFHVTAAALASLLAEMPGCACCPGGIHVEAN